MHEIEMKMLGHAFQVSHTFGQCCMQKTPWCQHITNIGKLNIKHIEKWWGSPIAKSRWIMKESRGEQTSTKACKLSAWISLAPLIGTLKAEMTIESLEVQL